MIESFFSSLGSKLLMTLLVTSTLLTTGVAVSKVSSSFASSQIPKKGINIEAAETSDTSENTVENSPTASVVRTVARTIARIPTTIIKAVTPTAIPVAVAIPKPTIAPSSSQCIIMISGSQYDVTKLRTTHSGGDVFKCGTDMTSVYIGRHGTDMSRMQAYLINSTNSNTSTGVTPTSVQITPTGSTEIRHREDDDREDREHEDRYIDRGDD